MPDRLSPSGRSIGDHFIANFDYTAGVPANGVLSVAVAVPAARLGDEVIVNPDAAGIAAGLVFAESYVNAAGFVTVTLGNLTGAPIAPAAAYTFHGELRRVPD